MYVSAPEAVKVVEAPLQIETSGPPLTTGRGLIVYNIVSESVHPLKSTDTIYSVVTLGETVTWPLSIPPPDKSIVPEPKPLFQVYVAPSSVETGSPPIREPGAPSQTVISGPASALAVPGGTGIVTEVEHASVVPLV